MRPIQLTTSHLTALALWVLVGCQPASPSKPPSADAAAPVVVARVAEIRLDRTLPVLGTLFAKDQATLAAEVEGEVEKTRVEFGDRIKAEQELALIDTSTYQAELLRAEAHLNRAKAAAGNTETQLRRMQALAVEKIAAASDLDQARAAHDEALAGVKAAEAERDIARIKLGKSQVRAPFDAAVSERIASAGDFVRVGAPLFRIVDDRVLKFIVQVPERHAAQIQKGQRIVFSVDAWPGERFSGSVFLISPAVNTATRAFSLGALVDNEHGRLKANTFARGELTLQKDVPVLAVPTEAVIQSSGISRVFVSQSGTARSRVVQAGRISDGLQEITQGLNAGDEILVSGHLRLIDGARIQPRTQSERPASVGEEGATGR